MIGNVPLHRGAARRPVWLPRSLAGPLMVLPCVGLLLVFAYWPVVRGVVLSLYGNDLLGDPTRFVGLDQYAELFTDPELRRALLTTVVIAGLSVLLSVGGALAAVLPLRRAARRPRAVVSVLLSMPFAYSAAASAAVFAGLFAPAVGTLNQVLAHLGVTGPEWLRSPEWAILSVSIATAWYEFGFAFLVLLAAMTQLDQHVIEAAALDGASGPRLARSVIIPMLRPSLIFLLVTQTISGLQVFTQVQVLTRGGPADATSTLVFELYQRAFGEALPHVGSASALAVVLLLLVLLITAIQFRVLRRWA
ncbi:sugar ABC transporter permease [Streptomyces sp. K1PN6]|uniref:Sugar ABC transporter permease n=2 Tax=Streptomyces acidicola TaxID=2596892 RepID=A0A5N8WU78_9ACTN|nr:sugar ABC transporter permease [Streptomyces acidicola]